MTLVEEIELAFGSAQPPPEPLVEAVYLDPNAQGDEGATEYFSGKSWKGLDVQWLRYHRTAMFMFTPRAHQYYLPAFMIASVEEPREADEIPDHIIWHLAEYEDPFWWERIRILSPAQCDASVRFVRTVADEGHGAEKVKRAIAGLERAKQGG